jgi:Zn-dependent protease
VITAFAATCEHCRSELGPALLVCPGCQRLVHATRLAMLSGEAEAAEREQRRDDAVGAWRQALELLPPDSRQAGIIRERVATLRREKPSSRETSAERASRSGGWTAGALVGGAALLWKFKFVVAFVLTKGKLLLLGLAKAPTALSMLASIGVYWTIYGLWLAVGFIAAIYVHEMGHVAALTRYGVPASAPMFIPGLGAFVRAEHMPANVSEQARIGLAGPLWGLGATGAALLGYLASGNLLWAAIAHLSALINLFNLVPIWQLDGSRGFVALSRYQRWLFVLALAFAYLATQEGLLVLVLIVAAGRALIETAPQEPDHGALGLFAALVVGFSVIAVSLPTPAM